MNRRLTYSLASKLPTVPLSFVTALTQRAKHWHDLEKEDKEKYKQAAEQHTKNRIEAVDKQLEIKQRFNTIKREVFNIIMRGNFLFSWKWFIV